METRVERRGGVNGLGEARRIYGRGGRGGRSERSGRERTSPKPNVSSLAVREIDIRCMTSLAVFVAAGGVTDTGSFDHIPSLRNSLSVSARARGGWRAAARGAGHRRGVSGSGVQRERPNARSE